MSPTKHFFYNQETRARLRKEAGTFSYTNRPISEAILDYYHRCGYATVSGNHAFGMIQTSPYRIALHTFSPPNSQGVVVLIHGYLDHSGTLLPTAQILVDAGYTVALFDLPGHGLSEGYCRAGVQDFSEYSDALSTVVATLKEEFGKDAPVSVIGHSTGCVPIITQLLHEKHNWSGKTILVAPLIRSAVWWPSKIGFQLIRPFRSTVPRLFRKCSDEDRFLKKLKQDPLRISRTPVCWVEALYRWEKELQSMRPIATESLIVLQGDIDKTVHFTYNLAFIAHKLKGCHILLVQKGRHHLLNEDKKKKKAVETTLLETLSAEKADFTSFDNRLLYPY